MSRPLVWSLTCHSSTFELDHPEVKRKSTYDSVTENVLLDGFVYLRVIGVGSIHELNAASENLPSREEILRTNHQAKRLAVAFLLRRFERPLKRANRQVAGYQQWTTCKGLGGFELSRRYHSRGSGKGANKSSSVH